jgi:hypothetical protein
LSCFICGLLAMGSTRTASQHGSTRGRGGEYVTGYEFTAVLGLDSFRIL